MKKFVIAMFLSAATVVMAAPPVTRVTPVTVVPAVKKPKILRSNPFRLISIRLLNANPVDQPDDEDLAVDRRRELRVDREGELDLDDQTKLRLALARVRALERYHQIWG